MNARLDAKDLDPNDQKDLEALASETGKNPDELLRELIHEALAERKRNGQSSGKPAKSEVPPELSLAGLAGIGKELWQGEVDAQEYVKKLRDEWVN